MRQALWETFVEEGYASAPKPLIIIEKWVPSFDIFTEQMNGIKESFIEEPTLEELVLTPEPEKDVPIVEPKSIDDQEEELNFTSYVLNSIIDVFL